MFTHLRPTVSRTFSYALGTIGMSLLVACSGAGKDNGDSSIASDLDADNGAMTTADELPFFNDPNVEGLPSFESVQIDPNDMTTEVAQQAGATRYHVALLWGHLPQPEDTSAADTDPVPADWTGSLSVDAGAIGVKKTLMFDAHDQVLPRSDAKEVDFKSHTMPYVDGLFLHVVIPAGGSTLLHVKTASFTEDIDLATLGQKAGGVDRIPQSPNGLAYLGYPDVAGCARGLVFGRWVKTRAAAGRFRGHVVDGDGETLGHVRGIWGHAARHDADLFFGKYIDANGKFEGLLGGKYDGGEFHGLWGTRDPNAVGTLEGFYSDGYDKDDGRGVFLGRYGAKCN